MLKTLYARNYALIEEVDIRFSNGLNILTGETGAGKSILIDALGLILGNRASSEDVRHGADKAVIEGVFTLADNEPARRILIDHGYDNGDELIVRREVTSKGTSRAFVNDSPAPLTFVKDLGDHLVDLHGQHEHQMLLRPETHIGMLDNAGGLEKLVRDFGVVFAELHQMGEELAETRRREVQLKEKQEFYQYQLTEIDAVSPLPGEDEMLQQELRILENTEKIYELTSLLHSTLYEDENSVRDQLLRGINTLDQLTAIDPAFADYRNECSSASVIVQEIAKFVQSYSARMEYSPTRLEEIRERLFKLSGLRKKFGGSIDAVISYRESIAREIELAENFDAAILEMEARLEARREHAGVLAAKLSQKRVEVARKVERAVESTLKSLGIDKGKFAVHIDQQPGDPKSSTTVRFKGKYLSATAHGFDRVEFFISTNVGEDPKPLVRVASGGEISRVMLSLKSILAKNNRLPLLVFDEIDTGISGRIASKVGAAMRNLADFHQIIAITHLPQIAAMGSSHFVVEKKVQSSRTITQVRRLEAEEHTREVAKLMSGENITESSLQMARELIGS
jgi:DNA repair protein RecN (Recombination protein N)